MKDPSLQADKLREKLRKLYIQGCWKGDWQDPHQVPAATETLTARGEADRASAYQAGCGDAEHSKVWEPLSPSTKRTVPVLPAALIYRAGSEPWQHTRTWSSLQESLWAICAWVLWQYVKHRVRNSGGSLLLGQRHLCWPNLSPGKVCCLPGAWVLATIDRMLLRLAVVWPLDYYPQVLFHSGTMDTAKGDWECTKHNYTVHRVLAKLW